METNFARFSLLIVDDERQMHTLLRSVFAEAGYSLVFASSGSEALAKAAGTQVDAALIDLVLPGMGGLALLGELRDKYPEMMVLMMTGRGGVREAVEAIKLGAVDFLEKPFSAEAMQARVAQLHRIWNLNRENKQLRTRLQGKFDFPGLIGHSTAILKAKELIAQVGPTDATILIQGESGTGKELVARAIHRHSPRASGPFVPVDCGAISQTVMESELFGHQKGAFTGAHVATLGLIRSADRGTLFLDEVGELPLAIQVKLLRTIQEREVRPVGHTRSFPVDVRILAATHRDLRLEVAEGRFREDLFFRLNVLTLNVPPLRDRVADIPLLAAHFLERLANGSSSVRQVSREAMGILERYGWPGNVRELENTIRRAVALGRGEAILPEDLPDGLAPAARASASTAAQVDGDTFEAYESAAMRNALVKAGGNRAMAARILGIGEATLYRKIKKYAIDL
jgi:DNA-binding NtrC family response regulator